MPVMIIIRAPTVTEEAYDAVRAAVGWDQVPPAGALSHAISFTDEGMVEVNVWESRALFDDYVETRLKPVLDDGDIVLDDIQILDTYNVAVGAPALPYLLHAKPDPAPTGRVVALYPRTSVSPETYASFRDRAPIDTVPAGALAHVHARSGGDVQSIDVWDDAGEMMKFIEGTVIPAVEAEGIPFRWPEILSVETFLTTPAAKAHERPFTEPALAPAE